MAHGRCIGAAVSRSGSDRLARRLVSCGGGVGHGCSQLTCPGFGLHTADDRITQTSAAMFAAGSAVVHVFVFAVLGVSVVVYQTQARRYRALQVRHTL